MRHESAEFYRQHAGWSYDPKTETSDQGRDRTGRELAEAAAEAYRRGWWTRWESEAGWIDHVAEYDCYDREPETCEACILFDEDGEILASLGCIDDATDEYRAVVEAELADEALSR